MWEITKLYLFHSYILYRETERAVSIFPFVQSTRTYEYEST